MEKKNKPSQKITVVLRSTKDPKDPLRSHGGYKVSCSCGKFYIGTAKQSINTKVKEHRKNCQIGETDRSAITEVL